MDEIQKNNTVHPKPGGNERAFRGGGASKPPSREGGCLRVELWPSDVFNCSQFLRLRWLLPVMTPQEI